MRTFTVATEGQDQLGLRAIAEAYINDQWFAAHASNELAATVASRAKIRLVAKRLRVRDRGRILSTTSGPFPGDHSCPAAQRFPALTAASTSFGNSA